MSGELFCVYNVGKLSNINHRKMSTKIFFHPEKCQISAKLVGVALFCAIFSHQNGEDGRAQSGEALHLRCLSTRSDKVN